MKTAAVIFLLAFSLQEKGEIAPNHGDEISRSIEDIISGDSQKQDSAIAILTKHPTEAIAPLEEAIARLKEETTDAAKGALRRIEIARQFAIAGIDAHVKKLVQQLGDENYEERWRAHNALVDLGRFALEETRKATLSSDAEVKWRAKEIVRAIEVGPWQKGVENYCRSQGINPDSIAEILPDVANKFFVDDRFYAIKEQNTESHFRVTKEGEVIYIPLSSGGEVLEMVGGTPPRLASEEDVASFFRLIASLRYGFSESDIASVHPEERDGRWRAKVGSRSFEMTLDDDRRVKSIFMK